MRRSGLAGSGGAFWKNIEPRAGQPPRLEGFGQRGFVDDLAAGRLDQNRARFHLCDASPVQQPARGIGQGTVERHVVAGAEQGIEIASVVAVSGDDIAIQNPHAERRRP